MLQEGVLPVGADTFTGVVVRIKGITGHFKDAEVHRVNLQSPWHIGEVKVAIWSPMPDGVTFLLGQDLGGGNELVGVHAKAV